MRIERFASLTLLFSMTTFFACSQSGSPLGPENEVSESHSTGPHDASGSESAVAASDPEAAAAESLDEESAAAGAERAGSESGSESDSEADSESESKSDSEPDSVIESDPSESSETAETAGTEAEAPLDSGEPAVAARSVVDSILAGGAVSQSEGPEVAETGSASVQADAVTEVPGASKTANSAVDEGEAPIVSSASSAPVSGTRASPLMLDTDFEGEDLSCWNGNRASNGVNRPGCGLYTSIGSGPFALSEGGIARSGRKALSITYSKNEEAGGANVSINSDSVNVRAYYYFEPGFDFGQGLKIGRVSSFNTAKQVNDVDIILEVRSAKSSNQCGVTDMRDVGVFFNGAPKGSDWGNATATMAFERGRWYSVEYQVVLNAPGKSNGVVRLWVDGKLVAERLNLPIRGSLPSSAKLNVVKIGGWYSNGANGNSCKNPSQPAKLHMDDVAIAASFIGG